MGRSLNTAPVPILGSIFGNGGLNSNRMTTGDGAVYMGKVSYSGQQTGVVNSLEFPKAASGLAGYFKSLGNFNYSLPNPNFGVLQAQSDKSFPFTYGMHLAKNATTYQANKTENYYANGVDYPNVAMIGQFRVAYSPIAGEPFLVGVKYSGNDVTGYISFNMRNPYAQYYDTVNSANVWLGLNMDANAVVRISTTDGVNFTTSTLSGPTAIRYVNQVGSFKPCVFMSGNNGLFMHRAGTVGGSNINIDEVKFFQTSNNFATCSDITANWYSVGTGAGYPILFNYDGTTVATILGNGNSTTVVPKFSTNLGTTVSNATCSGDTSTFRGVMGGNSGMGGNAGAGLATCTGANASQFMYISYDQANSSAYSYYTANGGQTYTSKSLQSILDAVTTSNNTYDGFLCLNYHAGRWVALFQKQGLGVYAITSTNNGSTWSSAVKVFEWDSSYFSYSYGNLCQVFSHNGTFIAVKSSGLGNTFTQWAKSTNGTTWTAMTDPYVQYGEGQGFIELTNSFIVLGRVIDKTSMTITNYTADVMQTQSYYMHYMATSGQKLIAGQYNVGTAVVNDNVISSNIYATSVPAYVATYSTSGSAYGSYEYVRVK